MSNSDPITGQAGWYDLRVRIRPANPDEAQETFPRFPSRHPHLQCAVRLLPF
jgi:hypothetical protein